MKQDNNYQAPAVSLSSPLAEHESIKRADSSFSIEGSPAGPANAENLPSENLPAEDLPAEDLPADDPSTDDPSTDDPSTDDPSTGSLPVDNLPTGNLPGEQQDQTEAQEIDNIHTYAQGKSASILGEAISKLVSDLKNRRFENKKPPEN
jgi:hypothetical protein